jgi:hypothetical protein
VRLADERAAAQRATSAGIDAARQALDLRILEIVDELAPREEPAATPQPTAPMPAVPTEPGSTPRDTPAETPVEVSFEANGPDAADSTAE